MIEINENVMKSILLELSNDEKCVLPLAKAIMDKISSYYFSEKNAEMADVFRSSSALLSNLETIHRNGK